MCIKLKAVKKVENVITKYNSIKQFLTIVCFIFLPTLATAEVMIDAPAISKLSIIASQYEDVVVSVHIKQESTDPKVLQNGVNLLRLDSDDRVLANLGYLRDDGINGDRFAGDGIYAGHFTFKEYSPCTLRLAVSVSLYGQLKRKQSFIDIPVIKILNSQSIIVSTSATAVVLAEGVSLHIPAQAFGSGTLTLSTIQTVEFGRLANSESLNVTFPTMLPSVEIRSDELPQAPLQLKFPLGSVPDGMIPQAFASVKSYGEAVEEMLNGLSVTECDNGKYVCIDVPSILMDSEETSMVVRIAIGYIPRRR